MTLACIDRERARELDRRATDEYGLPGIVLMENAGRGVADKLCELGIDGTVVICCGPGNNGGDGFVLARHLDLRGYTVELLLWGWQPRTAGGDARTAAGAKTASDAALNLAVLEAAGFNLAHNVAASTLPGRFQQAAWVVDALLGTGARGAPRSPLDEVIAAINASGKPVLAVDLPSGLDCDTGAIANQTVRASHTCTFVANKPGFLAPSAREATGEVHVCDIGAPRVLVQQLTRPHPPASQQ